MQRKIFFLIFFCCLSNNICAQEAVLSLSGDNIVNIQSEESVQAKEETQPTNLQEIKAEEGSIFSFLQFWKEKKPEELKDNTKTQDNTALQETYEEKLIRMSNEGNVDADLALGYMYLYGDKEHNITINHEKSFQYYQKAAAQDNIVAINNLGSLYYSGIGTPRNLLEATRMFSKAASLGNSEAMLNLAFIYLSGKGELYRPKEAMQLFKQASDANNFTASFMLGYAHYKGFIVEKDYLQAFKLVKEAANKGFDEAMIVLSNMYMNGHGTPQNYSNGVKVLSKAAIQGNTEAMMLLAGILASGKRYPKNIVQAHIWYNLAATQGVPQAAEKRDLIGKSIKMEELLQAQAQAETFKAKPSSITTYIKQTFGTNVRKYIEDGITQETQKKLPETR